MHRFRQAQQPPQRVRGTGRACRRGWRRRCWCGTGSARVTASHFSSTRASVSQCGKRFSVSAAPAAQLLLMCQQARPLGIAIGQQRGGGVPGPARPGRQCPPAISTGLARSGPSTVGATGRAPEALRAQRSRSFASTAGIFALQPGSRRMGVGFPAVRWLAATRRQGRWPPRPWQYCSATVCRRSTLPRMRSSSWQHVFLELLRHSVPGS